MSSSDSLAVGTLYQGLRIRLLLSANELGALYLADDLQHGPVFLRVVRRSVIRGAEDMAQVEEDLARLEQVVHRNVARVIRGEEDEGEFFYVLEALGTSTLLDLARHCRPFYEREVVWLGRGISAGLAALHEAGLWHGGLLPSAVVVSHHGPIVVDLGWRDRIGSGERYSTEVCQQLDLQALRQVLVFSTSPAGDPQPFSPRIEELLARLAPGSAEPFASAREVAEAFREQAQRMGLPDPMAPESLQRLLERFEGVPGPTLDASQEGSPLGAPSGLGPARRLDGSQPLDPGESIDLEVSVADGAPLRARPPSSRAPSAPPLDAGASGSGLGESEDALASGTGSSAPSGRARGLGSRAPTASASFVSEESEETRRDTLAYARGMIEEFNDPPSVERGALPSVPDLGGSAESGRSERGLAPPLGAFGPFQLLDERAAEPDGTTFLASHPDHSSSLLVHVLLPGVLADDTARKRFSRQAQAAEALQHPQLARVVASGTEGEFSYLASEEVAGRPLRQVLAADGGRERARAPELVASALRALESAHGMGVVHGNLSPDCLWVGDDGRVRVSGFGRPRAGKKGRARVTAYTAPEQRSGDASEEAGDLYAMGAVLYEALTGKLPGEARGGPLLGSPPPPSALTRDLPRALDAITLTALAEDPQARYPGAGTFADDLEHLAATPRHARPLTGRQALGRWLAQRGGLAMLAGLSLAAGITLLAGVGAARVLGLDGPRGATPGPAHAGSPSPSARPEPDRAALVGERDELRRERDALSGERERLEREQAKLREDLERLEGGRAHERADQAQRLVELGAALLAGGKPELAEQAYRQALALAPKLEGARRGLDEARRAPRGAQGPGERDRAAQARRHLEAGQDHLAGDRFAEARSELLQAFALGAAEARPLLDRAQAGLVDERLRELDAERRAARQRRAATLVAEAAGLEDGAARARLLQALALDPESAPAREALAARTAPPPAPQPAASPRPKPGPDAEANERRRELALEAGEKHAARARAAYTEQRDLDEVIDAYFQALHHFARADALDPRMPTAGDATKRAAAELAAILREDGEVSFANQLLRFYDVDPVHGPQTAPPADPHLVVEEAERTSIRRAFGGVVRFEATHDFDALRAWVESQGDRFRIRVQVKSSIQPGFPPKVLATGLWVRLEDHQQKTITPPRRVDFSGGPYPRIVRVDGRGRILRPFSRASTLDPAPYVKEVEDLAKELLSAAKGKK
ncbi:MAG: protein kinase [Planctomycetota bacterium]